MHVGTSHMVGKRKSARRWLLRIHPVDVSIGSLLTVAVIYNLFAPHTPEVRQLLLIHAALLAAFFIFAAAAFRWSHAPWVLFVRPLLAVAIIYTLYSTLGKLGLLTQQPSADAMLSRVDTWLCGTDPSLYIQRWQSPPVMAFFAIVYALFIPYINVSIILGALGRPPLERDKFLTGWIFVYSVSYLGYLILPATGPIAYHAADYTTSLAGGKIYGAIVKVVDKSGGAIGAFPSLHVGSSLYLCLFDIRSHRLRGLTYLPLVILIYFATVFMRYHYVTDLIAGTLISVACLKAGPLLFEKWARARVHAGLAALPGGEADVLPDVPTFGKDDAEALFPGNRS